MSQETGSSKSGNCFDRVRKLTVKVPTSIGFLGFHLFGFGLGIGFFRVSEWARLAGFADLQGLFGLGLRLHFFRGSLGLVGFSASLLQVCL